VFDLVASGEEAHSSEPEGELSAVHQLVQSMHRLLSVPWPKTTAFGETLINFGKITGGPMRNIVASTACAQGIMRTSTQVDALLPLIKENLLPGVSLDILSSTEPFEYFLPKDFPHFLAGFGSDAPYLQEIGQPILFGPGSLSFAHRPDEQISIFDLERGVEAYQRIAMQIRKMPLSYL
jgi:acetylornithine deacetylase/succinyl-diaminopimelate desuccinylase-like protein